MDKLDRLGWAAEHCLEAYGLRISIRVSQAEALSRVTPCLPPGWKPRSAGAVDLLYSFLVGGSGPRPEMRRFHLLYAGTERIARSHAIEDVCGVLAADLQERVAALSPRKIFVHAGVVGWRGQAIVLPGSSLSGKSTLVAALLQAGATYYSDEYAVIDARGCVHPYLKPISLRLADGSGARQCRPDEWGAPSGTRPIPVGLVVVSKYRPEAKWRPRPLTSGQGLLHLLAHTVPARLKPKRVLATLRQAVAAARLVKGTRGEADITASALLELLEARGQALSEPSR